MRVALLLFIVFGLAGCQSPVKRTVAADDGPDYDPGTVVNWAKNHNLKPYNCGYEGYEPSDKSKTLHGYGRVVMAENEAEAFKIALNKFDVNYSEGSANRPPTIYIIAYQAKIEERAVLELTNLHCQEKNF